MWNEVMAAILKLRHQIETPTKSIDVYLLTKCHHPNSVWNDNALGFLQFLQVSVLPLVTKLWRCKSRNSSATLRSIETGSPLHRGTDVGHEVIKVLARQRLISHLKEHLLCLNKTNDRLQQRRTTFVLEWIEQRVIMNSRLHAKYTQHVDDNSNSNDIKKMLKKNSNTVTTKLSKIVEGS